MAVRDPATGKFVSSNVKNLLDMEEVHLEYRHFYRNYRVSDEDLDNTDNEGYGETQAFEGDPVFELDEDLDRDEVALLLDAETYVAGQIIGGDATPAHVTAAFELSAQENLETARHPRAGQDGGIETANNVVQDGLRDGTATNSFIIDAGKVTEDTADLVHRPVRIVLQNSFSDQTNGQGGGQAVMADEASGPLDPEDWLLDDRDSLFINGSIAANLATAVTPTMHVQGSIAVAEMPEDTALDILTR